MSHKVILVSRTYIGKDDELGKKLFASFWRTLSESILAADTICFLHEGVKMLLPDSPVVEPLQLMAKDDVNLIACKTCCEYYDISDKIVVGKIVTMGDIQEKLFASDVISI
jgi:hypothetical protein